MRNKKNKKTISEAINWYSEKKTTYDQLSKKIESIIKEIIDDNSIPIHAIYSRAKEIDSFAKKIEDPKYTDPISQITDLSGIRIITYVESDLDKVCKILEAHFDIDPVNSMDKSKSLGTDKVGYRSIHYICKLPAERIKLPEYKKFNDLSFEIQIRTILQHAWAEIEHDKDYKFSGELPAYLKRRFKVLAGVLELADREFNGIAFEIDAYRNTVDESTKKGELDIPIDSTSLKSYLSIKLEDLIKKGMKSDFYNDMYEKKVLAELRILGIETLKDLDAIIPKNFSEQILKFEPLDKLHKLNYGGILRDFMLIADVDRYFKEAWQENWSGTSESTIDLMKSYNVPIVKYIQKHNIQVLKRDAF